MNNIKNQRGVATLEMILAVTILGIFSAVAVPNMARLLDKACLDYEMKHLYSTLSFARSIGKSSETKGAIFAITEKQGGSVELWLYGKGYGNEGARNRYQIMRPDLNTKPYFRHNLQNDILLDYQSTKLLTIPCNGRTFESSYTIDLISKYGKSARIKIDTVGRVRGTY